MKYQIVLTAKSGSKDKKESYDNQHSAQKKIDKTYKNKNVEIIPIPKNIDIGYKLYTKGELYGTIIEITPNYYYVNRVTKDENDKVEFLKDSFEDKFINKIFEGREWFENNKTILHN